LAGGRLPKARRERVFKKKVQFTITIGNYTKRRISTHKSKKTKQKARAGFISPPVAGGGAIRLCFSAVARCRRTNRTSDFGTAIAHVVGVGPGEIKKWGVYLMEHTSGSLKIVARSHKARQSAARATRQ